MCPPTADLRHGDRVVEELDGDGNLVAIFVYGPYVDEVLQMRRDTNDDHELDATYYYLHDDLYNVLALTDADGDVVERYEYGDYGAPTIPDGLLGYSESNYGNPFMFNGREYDADTGLYFYRTRYMDPELGRFLSRDTIGLWGDANNLGNPYTYVGNNPWTHLDPYGEGPEDPFGTDDYITEATYTLGSMASSLAKNTWAGIKGTGAGIYWWLFAGDEAHQEAALRVLAGSVEVLNDPGTAATSAASSAWAGAKDYGNSLLNTPASSGDSVSQAMLFAGAAAAPYAKLGSLTELGGLANLGKVTNRIDDVSPLRNARVYEVPKPQSVTYFRVQGGGSRPLVEVDSAGNVTFKQGTSLNVSTGTAEHTDYFLSKRPGGNITSFEIPDWLDDMIRENAIDQKFYKTNPLNQGRLAPKEVDLTTPGTSYELPPLWSRWLQENVIPGSGRIVGGG